MVWVSLSTILRLSDRMHHILFLLVDLYERSESIRFVKDLDLLDLSDLNLLDLYQIYMLSIYQMCKIYQIYGCLFL